MKYAMIKTRTEETDYSDIPVQDCDWTYSAYANVKEVKPKFVPNPLDKRVVVTTYLDTNLYYDMLTVLCLEFYTL